jgi:adenosylcobyric acid synthase
MCKGYEIHQGRTEEPLPPPSPVEREPECEKKSPFMGDLEGLNCIGTYIHGFLDNPSVIEFILKGKVENTEKQIKNETYEEFKDRQYDLLADHVRKYVDIKRLYEIIAPYSENR